MNFLEISKLCITCSLITNLWRTIRNNSTKWIGKSLMLPNNNAMYSYLCLISVPNALYFDKKEHKIRTNKMNFAISKIYVWRGIGSFLLDNPIFSLGDPKRKLQYFCHFSNHRSNLKIHLSDSHAIIDLFEHKESF